MSSPETESPLRASEPKTLQACDRCRTKKTRCVPVSTSDITGQSLNSTDSHRPRSCKVCSAAEVECTFDLPLTASRAKRVVRASGRRGAEGRKAGELSASIDADGETSDGSAPVSPVARAAADSASSAALPGIEGSQIPRDTGSIITNASTASIREGPTSIPYILHSTPTIPLADLEPWRAARRRSIFIRTPNPGSGSGDGVMLHHHIPRAPIAGDTASAADLMSTETWTLVVNRLVEAYFALETELLPVVLPGEEGGTLATAMAAISAARRDCPNEIFWTLRAMLNQEIAEKGIMDIPSLPNVQTLLLASLLDDMSDVPGPAPAQSVARARAARAVRLALDLGLDASDDVRERRVWRCVVVVDTWLSAKFGARTSPLPTLDRTVSRGAQMTAFDAFHDLALLLNRLLGLIYGPSGIRNTPDAALLALASDLGQWQSSLPSSLAFNGPHSSLAAGALHLHYAALLVLLYRPFMRWSFMVGPGMSLDLNLAVWRHMVDVARGAVDWAAQARVAEVQDLCPGPGPGAPYAFVLCAWIAYHHFARRREVEGRELLDKARGAVGGWEKAGRKLRFVFDEILSTIPLLLELTAIDPRRLWDDRRGLNPTVGVLNRLPETTIEGITFLRDSSHPAGGILVATQKAAAEIKDLPEDAIIIGGKSSAAPPLEVPPMPAGPFDTFATGGMAMNGGVDLMGIDWDATIASFAQTDYTQIQPSWNNAV